MNEEAIIKALSDVLTPYFHQGLLRIPWPDDLMPDGDFLAVEITDEDPEGFRIVGLEPPEPDEMDDEHLAYIARLRDYVRKLFKVADIELAKEKA